MADHPVTRAEPSPAVTSGNLVAILAVGSAAGFLAGLFGVGGGILIVPGLVIAAGMDQRLAHGTSLAAVLPISVASFATFHAASNASNAREYAWERTSDTPRLTSSDARHGEFGYAARNPAKLARALAPPSR